MDTKETNQIESPNCLNKKCQFWHKMFIENCSKGIFVYECGDYKPELELLPMAKQLKRKK